MIALILTPLACASASVERREYILAHPHGWVEVSLDDREIPFVPPDEEHPEDVVRPNSCSMEVFIDREPWVQGEAYPIGSAPPFSVKTGFRIPVAIGAAEIAVTYSGCDVESGRVSTVKVTDSIMVSEDRVTEVLFDGRQLRAMPAREDSVVTLEEILEAVTGRSKPNAPE